jgi:hypothetical protein
MAGEPVDPGERGLMLGAGASGVGMRGMSASGGGSAIGRAPNARPHVTQKAAPAGLRVPHDGHAEPAAGSGRRSVAPVAAGPDTPDASGAGAPHSTQKFPPAGISASQFAQRTILSILVALLQLVDILLLHP